MKKTLLLFIALVLALPLSAAYKKGKLIWKMDFTRTEIQSLRMGKLKDGNQWVENEGINGDGALYCKGIAGKGTPNCIIPLFPAAYKGLIFVEAVVKGVNIRRGTRAHHGPKVMFHYQVPGEGGKWSALPYEFGSFDWKTWVLIEYIPEKTASLDLYIRLQDVAGEFWVDSIRIYHAEEIPDQKIIPPENKEAAKIPRGRFLKQTNPLARRGVMSGRDLSEEAFRVLKSWNVNLLRMQISGFSPAEVASGKLYLEALKKKLDFVERVLALCRKYGISMVIDLHRAPLTERSKYSSNMIPADYDSSVLEEAWRMIAMRFREDPAVFGFDIVNEPSVAPEVWSRIFLKVLKSIRKVDRKTPLITESIYQYYSGENVIYSPHFYSPHSLTHYGVGNIGRIKWSYPNYINGVYWDKEQIRLALKPVIDFQRKHNARIYIGEFSCVPWVEGADRYLNDCIEIFDEYGWDWSYHAFREAPMWNVEYEAHGIGNAKMKPAKTETARKKALLKGLRNNLHVIRNR